MFGTNKDEGSKWVLIHITCPVWSDKDWHWWVAANTVHWIHGRHQSPSEECQVLATWRTFIIFCSLYTWCISTCENSSKNPWSLHPDKKNRIRIIFGQIGSESCFVEKVLWLILWRAFESEEQEHWINHENSSHWFVFSLYQAMAEVNGLYRSTVTNFHGMILSAEIEYFRALFLQIRTSPGKSIVAKFFVDGPRLWIWLSPLSKPYFSMNWDFGSERGNKTESIVLGV